MVPYGFFWLVGDLLMIFLFAYFLRVLALEFSQNTLRFVKSVHRFLVMPQ